MDKIIEQLNEYNEKVKKDKGDLIAVIYELNAKLKRANEQKDMWQKAYEELNKYTEVK